MPGALRVPRGEDGVARHLDPHVAERRRLVAVAGRARDAADDLAFVASAPRRTRERRRRRSRARGAFGSRGRGSAGARSAPGPDSSPSRSRSRARRAPPRRGGRGRRSRVRSAACPARIRSSSSSSSSISSPSSARRRAPRRRPPRSPRSAIPPGGASRPTTTDDACSSSSISHFVANRERRSVERTRSPSPCSVRSRKSSTPRRSTTSGAITRAFGVRRSASQASPTPTPRRRSRPSPADRTRRRGRAPPTKSRGRRPTRAAVPGMTTSVAAVFRGRAERKVSRPDTTRRDSHRASTHREVAGAPRGLDPANRSRDLGLLRRGRGRESDPTLVGGAQRAAAHVAHAGHPLRHALEPLRRRRSRASTGAPSSRW